MFGITDYGTYIATIVLFLLVPGPGNLALITSTANKLVIVGGGAGTPRASGTIASPGVQARNTRGASRRSTTGRARIDPRAISRSATK